MKNNKKKPKTKCTTIMSCFLIIFLSLIFLAVTFLTYFGLYVALNNLTRPAQTVTVSSDGPASEMYPDSMGQYKILEEVYRYDRPVYKHVDREDRFIIYAGNRVECKTDISLYLLDNHNHNHMFIR